MKVIIIITVISILYGACSDNKKPTITTQKGVEKVTVDDTTPKKLGSVRITTNDTLYIAQDALIIHLATTQETAKWRKNNEGAFEESLADNVFYLDETSTAAKKQHIPIITTTASLISFAQTDGKKMVWQREKNYEGWGAIAFMQDKQPKKIDITNASIDLKNYFTK